MLTILFFTFFLKSLLFAGGSHWNEEQVEKYVSHSELQRRSSWQLISNIHFDKNQKILDIGCGDGRNTAWIACMVRESQVIGIDPSEAMINWAKKQYHPFEFPNLAFQSGDANHLPEGVFDVITAFFSLHIVEDKQAAAHGFYQQLAPGGQLIAVIPPNSRNTEFSAAFAEAMSDPAWRAYFTDFQSTFCFEELEDYVEYLERAGFTVTHAQYVSSVDPFVNKNQFANWFIGTWPHMHYLPKDQRKAFALDIAERYIQKRPSAITDEGVLHCCWGRYEVMAQK